MVTQKEKLQQELKWVREAIAYKDSEREHMNNVYFVEQTELPPPEFEFLFQMDEDALKPRRDRLKSDIQQLRE